jgi:methyltransferase (TIGR00027 family)
MAKQAAAQHKTAEEHDEQAAHQDEEASKGYEMNQHERRPTMPTSRMAIANRRSILGLTRRRPPSHIMGMSSGATKDGAYGSGNTLFAQAARQLGFFSSIIKKRALSNPGFSNSTGVAEFRYIQSLHETCELQNPDRLVGQFLPLLRQCRCIRLSQSKVALLRTNPFYYYLDARTRYYDKVFLDAIADQVHYIINVGCGMDTRAYRFAPVLRQKGVKVLECDQPQAIQVKQGMAKRVRACGHVTYVSLDLNDATWPDFEHWLVKNNTAKALVMMEGVSPYINGETFRWFLRFLAGNLSRGSRVAYDFKLRGVADEFGRVGRTQRPFRLEGERAEITAFHEPLGFRLEHFERSSDLTVRLLGNLEKPRHPLFLEDALIQLAVTH